MLNFKGESHGRSFVFGGLHIVTDRYAASATMPTTQSYPALVWEIEVVWRLAGVL
jgi:hypothetical protein